MKDKLKWLDPFFYVDKYLMPVVNPNGDSNREFIVHLVSAFVFAWLFLLFLGLVFQTDMPISVVMSASMEPVLNRGDIIFLWGGGEINSLEVSIEKYIKGKSFSEIGEIEYEIVDNVLRAKTINLEGKKIELETSGDIVVYWSELQKKSIIHRTVLGIQALDGKYYLTKGDSLKNPTIDQDCGVIINGLPKKACITLYPVSENEIQGKVFFVVPYLGCAKIWLTDNLFYLLLKGRLPSDFNGLC